MDSTNSYGLAKVPHFYFRGVYLRTEIWIRTSTDVVADQDTLPFPAVPSAGPTPPSFCAAPGPFTGGPQPPTQPTEPPAPAGQGPPVIPSAVPPAAPVPETTNGEPQTQPLVKSSLQRCLVQPEDVAALETTEHCPRIENGLFDAFVLFAFVKSSALKFRGREIKESNTFTF